VSRSKYGNRKTVVDGIEFDSAAEARRWTDLRVLERVGLVRDIRRQVVFPLCVNGVEVCKYEADFIYDEIAARGIVIEDVKGIQTAVFRLKARFMAALGTPVTIRTKDGSSKLLDFKPKKVRKKK